MAAVVVKGLPKTAETAAVEAALQAAFAPRGPVGRVVFFQSSGKAIVNFTGDAAPDAAAAAAAAAVMQCALAGGDPLRLTVALKGAGAGEKRPRDEAGAPVQPKPAAPSEPVVPAAAAPPSTPAAPPGQATPAGQAEPAGQAATTTVFLRGQGLHGLKDVFDFLRAGGVHGRSSVAVFVEKSRKPYFLVDWDAAPDTAAACLALTGGMHRGHAVIVTPSSQSAAAYREKLPDARASVDGRSTAKPVTEERGTTAPSRQPDFSAAMAFAPRPSKK